MRRTFTGLTLGALATAGLSACASYDGLCFFECGSSRAGSTPLVAFLYPDGNVPKSDSIPVLHVPLTVGLTFLPDRGNANAVEAGTKERILARLRDRFRSLDYVRDIVVIPDSYLSAKGGFDSLAQVARLQNLDVVALVSYDQVANVNDNRRSLAYLTIIGAYLVRGSHSETSTLLDLAVVEPSTRSLLVRAGGTAFASDSSTAVDQAREVRSQSKRGLDAATDQLIAQLDHELSLFSERVRAGDGPVRVVRREHTGGGGALTFPWLLLLAGLPLLSRRCRCGSTHP